MLADAQWTCPGDPAGNNPNQVAKSIIDQITPRFIRAGVKFVMQVGDFTEHGGNADIQVCAAAVQPLLDAGIGFFPMRGNHEISALPTGTNGYGIPQFLASFPQTRGLSNTFGAVHFSSPIAVSSELNGLSYAFDYGVAGHDARFVVIDPWATPARSMAIGKYRCGYAIGAQQAWIGAQLDAHARGTLHAFVFAHQPLMAEYHQDSPFAGNTATNPAQQNAFIASLQANAVKYYICGHDHLHQRSLIASPDGFSVVEEIIGASDSSKFYAPQATDDAGWAAQKYRETSLSQERSAVGYYIYTVDGPRVTVDYYADDHGHWQSDSNYPSGYGLPGNQVTPTFRFVRKETFGYSLNGQRFLVPQGGSYTGVIDRVPSGAAYGEQYRGTTAYILAGGNSSTNRDFSGRAFTREIDTGWTPTALASDALMLWGLADLGSNQTDPYVLALTYDPTVTTRAAIQAGTFGLVSRITPADRWVNATSLNVGGIAPKCVLEPWHPGQALGVCGVDTNTATAWAVVNHPGQFAVGPLP